MKNWVFEFDFGGLPFRCLREHPPSLPSLAELANSQSDGDPSPDFVNQVLNFRHARPKPLPVTESRLLPFAKEVRDLVSSLRGTSTSIKLNHFVRMRDYFLGDGYAEFLLEYNRHLPNRIIEFLNHAERFFFQRANIGIAKAIAFTFGSPSRETEAKNHLECAIEDLEEAYTRLLNRIEESLHDITSGHPVASTQQLSIVEHHGTGTKPHLSEKISRNYIRKEIDLRRSGRGRRTDLKTLGVVHVLDSYGERGMDRKGAISEILRKYNLSEESVRKVFDKHFEEPSSSTD